MNNLKNEDGMELEMQSLVRETLGNGSEHRSNSSAAAPPPPAPPENPWKKRGIVLVAIASLLLLYRGSKTDSNLAITNVDKLPTAPLVEMPDDFDPLRGKDATAPPIEKTPLVSPVAAAPTATTSAPVASAVAATAAPVASVAASTTAPVASAVAATTAPVASAVAATKSPVEAPKAAASPIPPAPVLAPLEPFQALEKPGYKHPPDYFSDTYIRRAKPSRQPPNKALAKKWGAWTFTDPQENSRPDLEGLFEKYPNRDVPREQFPPNAWQVDPNYLKEFLPQAIALAERGLAAILAEYGHYTPGGKLAEALKDDTNTDPAFMFSLSNMTGGKYPKKAIGNGGLASPSVFKRLRRKLLHAIITQDSFLLTMGGHSSAAGHGNTFQQSYTIQTQRALEPIFARLGVYHFSRNIGMGGLGTCHNGMASESFYGGDNDLLYWDSSMTEKPSSANSDMFARNGLLKGQKVPLLVGGPEGWTYETAGQTGRLEVGMWGTGSAGIPKTESMDTLDSVPYAARYLDCTKDVDCRKLGYNSLCWINRTDVEPVTAQQKVMGGRAKWHPGNHYHQLKARFLIFTLLKVLRQALIDWSKMDGFVIQDEEWHVTAENERIRKVVQNVTDDSSRCFQLMEKGLPKEACTGELKARSEFTPRANPASTSIRSILVADMALGDPEPNLYDPPDVYNPALDPPLDSDVDFVAIVENGIDFKPLRARHKYLLSQLDLPPFTSNAKRSNLVAGKGWSTVNVAPAEDNCDGTYTSFCKRPSSSNCLLYGHNDHRGSLTGDGLSGWLLMNLNGLEKGVVMVMGGFQGKNQNPKTLGWRCENNAEKCDHPISEEEANDEKQPGKNEELCPEARVEFAIDGKVVKSLSKAEFEDQIIGIDRIVHVLKVLEDSSFVPRGKTKDIELGMRIIGCARRAAFDVNFVYWA